MQIGSVTHQIERIFLLRSFDGAVIDAIKQPGPAHKERSARFGSRLHLILHTPSRQLPRAGKNVNSFLTKMQRDRRVRVNPDNYGLATLRRDKGPRNRPLWIFFQAIERDGTASICPSGRWR